MIKITALNELPSSDSEDEDANTLTKEAQEQVALNEYNRALELMLKNEKEEALSVFKDLLETELLDQVEKPKIADGRSRPMLSLKYSCFKNIGKLQAELENYDDAIQNYLEAANLDDSDVMLWYNMGRLSFKMSSLEMACSAFKQGLKCNPNHWPCLDNIITVLYAIPDYMNCLIYISLALERDPSYIKGLAFRKKIFDDIPFIEEYYKMYNTNWKLDPPLDTEFDHVIGKKILSEAKVIAKKWRKTCKPEFESKSVPDIVLRKSVTKYTWLELGQCLVDLHKYITETKASFVSRVDLVVKLKVEEKLITTMENILQNINVNNGDMPMIPEENTDFNDIEKMNIDNNIENYFLEEKDNLNEDLNFDNNGQFLFGDKPNGKESCTNDKESGSNDFQMIADNFFKEYKSSEKEETAEEESNGKLNCISTEEDSSKNNHKSNDVSEKSSKADEEKMNGKENKRYKEQKVKKRRRSSLCQLNQWPSAWSSTNSKRSLRARGNNRKECERDDGLLEEELRRLLPPNLLPDNVKFREEPRIVDEDMDTMDLYNILIQKENNSNTAYSSDSSKPPTPHMNEYDNYFDTEREKLDVEEFVKQQGKNNFMVIIAKFTEFLCTKWNYKWPEGLSELFLLSYSLTREYIPHPSPFRESIDDCILQMDAEMTLLFCELFTDKWLSDKPTSRPVSSSDKLGIGIPAEELGYIIFVSVRDDLYSEEDIFYLFRVLWLKANIYFCQGDADISIETLELLLQHMQSLEEESKSASLKLINCKHNSCISLQSVKKMLTSIRREQKLREVKTLYKDKKYAEVSGILQDTFKFAKQSNAFFCSDVNVDRVQHQTILLDCLWELHQYEDCYVWAEACLHESWNTYITLNPYAEESSRKKWVKSILNALEKLESCVGEVSTFVVKYLSEVRRARLVQNLVRIIIHQLDVLETSRNMPIETVLPWILLHYIMQYEEDKERAKSGSPVKSKSFNSTGESEDEDDDIPASITILFVSHEFLGRQGWCCINQGKLLQFIMKLIIPKLCIPLYSAIKDKLKRHLEQIFYCLYNHPAKTGGTTAKTKLKHLEDHSARHIELTWEAAQLLFEFYRPQSTPGFDTKNDSISVDTMALFKKIGQLIPAESNPVALAESMNAYLLEKQNDMPSVEKPLHSEIASIYYLIADHYFKGGLWEEAMQYYTLDLCFHPAELNSWAALAMSIGTLMETWLNNCNPKITEATYLSNAKIAQRSYEHAIQLSPSHLVIWTEYGNFVYAVHSYCSRLLKQESESLSMERFQLLETRKEEMLEKANHCFSSANSIYIAYQDTEEPQDERWLYQYMLAKVSEKRSDDPPVFLKHYSQASLLLFQNNAKYPSRISGLKTVPHLSIEALEVYYRIHASILKYLEQHEGKPLKKSLGVVFQEHLKECKQGPFMAEKSSSQKKDDNADTDKLPVAKPIVKEQNDLPVVTPAKIETVRSSIEEIEVVKFSDPGPGSMFTELPIENRKRTINEDLSSPSNTKRMKIADPADGGPEEIMILSSDDELSPRKSVSSNNKHQDPLNMDSFSGKNTDAQELMDALMRKELESTRDKDLSITDEDEVRKSDGTWLQNEDFKDKENGSEKQDDKKKSKKVLSRRGSQDSTTSNQSSTTGSNNSSCSSSDSSSSDDSSSSSSSDSESESGDSDSEKKKKEIEADDKAFLTEEETNELVESCLTGLEQCILRFAEHFKSIYRIAHFFFNNKSSKNTAKCKQLLLDNYKCQFHPGQTIQGLFKDRKSTNFFHGIWRIPVNEIDRAGSFAFHMSRCVLLLMQVLKETNDSQMLSELYIQLSKIPDFEKRYLKDQERKQLSQQALTLCVQSIRSKIQSMNTPETNAKATEKKITTLIEIYKIYEQVKNMNQNQNKPDVSLNTFKSLLKDAYKAYPGNPSTEANIFHLAENYCRTQIRNREKTAKQMASPVVTTAPSIQTPTTSVSVNHNPVTTTTGMFSSTVQHRKTPKSSTTGRPRGRPPNTHKYSPNIPRNTDFINQFHGKSGFANYIGNQDPKVFGEVMKCWTEMSCKDALRQYREQNNLTGMNAASVSGSNLPKTDNLSAMRHPGMGHLMAQQKMNATGSTGASSFAKNSMMHGTNKVPATMSTTKDRPDISITPVKADNSPLKPKMTKSFQQNDNTHAIQLSNSVQITPTKLASHSSGMQMSLLKPTVGHTSKNASSKQIPKSQIRMDKVPQDPLKIGNIPPAYSSYNLNAGMNASNFPFGRGSDSVIIKPSGPNIPRSTNSSSLQHKLLSKKQAQSRSMPQSQATVSHSRPTLLTDSVQITKTKKLPPSVSKPILHGPAEPVSILSASSKSKPPYMKSELSNISVSTLPTSSQAINMKVGTSKKVPKMQTSALDISPSPHTTAEALSMLSQLQQNSHLEIIPQGNQVKPAVDIGKNISCVRNVSRKTMDDGKPHSTDYVTVHELGRKKPEINFSITPSKRPEKPPKDSVEIITLDD